MIPNPKKLSITIAKWSDSIRFVVRIYRELFSIIEPTTSGGAPLSISTTRIQPTEYQCPTRFMNPLLNCHNSPPSPEFVSSPRPWPTTSTRRMNTAAQPAGGHLWGERCLHSLLCSIGRMRECMRWVLAPQYSEVVVVSCAYIGACELCSWPP